MAEVIKSPNCGNSPKNLFVQDLAIALSQRDTNFVLDTTSKELTWKQIGKQELQGQVAVAMYMTSKNTKSISKLTIHEVVTHSKAGAVNGIREFGDGTREEFCDVYEFTSAKGDKVQTITSYVIEGQK